VSATVRQTGELGLIRRFRQASAAAAGQGVVAGIGDDAAVLALAPGAALLATTDLVIEDVHFRRRTASPRDIGWKAMAVNLSDIAAMGGSPRWALVALAVPGSTDAEEVDACYAGMLEAASPHGVAIVGGDTSDSPVGFILNVTVLGEHQGSPRLRSMARIGDAVAVTGNLGRSAAGLAALELGLAAGREELARSHLRPTPRVAEGRWLGGQGAVHAMIDCSDGLATDLAHICRESVVSARVRLGRVPVSPAVREAARAFGRDPIGWATSGGEDYELLLTCEPAAVDGLARGLLDATGTPLTVVGEIAAGGPEVIWLGEDGERVAVPSGYEHFRG
jgi:thiamine-monophosphate kinase